MSTNNLISIAFTKDEIKKVTDALSTIENTIKSKVINLTPEQRQLYGKLGDKTENWITKVKQYMEQKPELVPFYLDKAEFKKDLEARQVILPILNRITAVHESLDDTAKLISTDVYNAAIAYYRNIKLVSQQNVPGTTNIFQDLSSQFPGRSSQVSEQPSTENPNNNQNTDS